MRKTQISTENAPQAIGPYSQAIAVGKTLYCSGQIPIDPQTGNIESSDIAEQTHRALSNVRGVLNAAKLDFCDVVKTTVYLTDLNDFATVNAIYGEYFEKPYPARSCVQVTALPKGAKIEIEVVARLHNTL
ncbi:MAG: RidA family protein [Clostridiales bacterium]|nr:RidA family protein [Clostridiales bacterium]